MDTIKTTEFTAATGDAGTRNPQKQRRTRAGATPLGLASHLALPPPVTQPEVGLVLSFLRDTIATIMRDD